MAGERIIRRGPIVVGGTLTQWANYALDLPVKIAEAYDATIGYKQTGHAATAWTATVGFEFMEVGRNLGTLGLGSYTGATFSEYTLRLECDIEEATGGSDDWQRWAVKNYGWQLDITRWQANEAAAVFLALLETQTDTPWAAVAATTPYGGGEAYISKSALSGGDRPSDETLTAVGKGAFTPTDEDPDGLIALLLAQIADAVTNDFATPTLVDFPEGYGAAFISSMELTVPSHDAVTATLELQGDGDFTLGARPE